MVHEDLTAVRHPDQRRLRQRHPRQLGHRRLTNAPIHLNALARHIGVELKIEDWQTFGEDVPLLVNLQPAGEYLGEDYHHGRRPYRRW